MVQKKQQRDSEQTPTLYQLLRSEPFADGTQTLARETFSPQCPDVCRWLPQRTPGAAVVVRCTCGRNERLNRTERLTGWASGHTSERESVAAVVLAAVEALDAAGVPEIVEVTGLSMSAVAACVRRLTRSRSGAAWLERHATYDAYRARTVYALTARGEMRLDADREAGLVPEVEDGDDQTLDDD